jgi:hypothetical protein
LLTGNAQNKKTALKQDGFIMIERAFFARFVTHRGTKVLHVTSPPYIECFSCYYQGASGNLQLAEAI